MLNEEETDQTGGESLQEAITANGSQLSASTLPLPARTRDGERGKVGEREREGGREMASGDGEERYEGMEEVRSRRSLLHGEMVDRNST